VETGNQSWRFAHSSSQAKIAAGVATPAKHKTKQSATSISKGVEQESVAELNLSTAV
jgi:hypothetical protein